jgi:hypothetical protein
MRRWRRSTRSEWLSHGSLLSHGRGVGICCLVASSGNFGEKLPLLAHPHAATVLPRTSPTVTSATWPVGEPARARFRGIHKRRELPPHQGLRSSGQGGKAGIRAGRTPFLPARIPVTRCDRASRYRVARVPEPPTVASKRALPRDRSVRAAHRRAGLGETASGGPGGRIRSMTFTLDSIKRGASTVSVLYLSSKRGATLHFGHVRLS